MSEKLNRLYGGISDDAMLTGAETMLDLFNVDKDLFNDLDADFNDAFSADFLEKIDTARDFPTDETVVDGITELTAEVNTQWNLCKAKFQDSKYFIEKAFPNNVARQNKYGFDDYAKMSTDQKKVQGFMDQFHDQAEADHVALIAAGYPQLKIDAIDTLKEAFRTADRAQEAGIKDRGLQTQTRIGLLNEVWKMIQRVNRASKNVFAGNYAKLQQYLLPAAGTNEAVEDLSVSGIVTNSVTALPVAGATVSLSALGLTTTTDDTGAFGFAAGTPAGSTAIIASADGYADFSSTVTIVDGSPVTKNIVMVPG